MMKLLMATMTVWMSAASAQALEVFPVDAESYLGRTENVGGAAGFGGTTGLAYASSDGMSYIDADGWQIAVTPCAIYQFERPVSGYLRLGYRHTSRIIAGDSCVSQYCGTDPGMQVLTSWRGGVWEHVSMPPAASERFTNNEAFVGNRFDSVLICRGGGGHARNNIEVTHLSVRVGRDIIRIDELRN